MANTKISQLTALTTPTWSEEFVYAYNNANWKVTLNTVKSFVWSTWISTLSADANIWELTDWFYETEYDLYYKSWEHTPKTWTTWAVNKQFIIVFANSDWEKCFFVLNAASKDSANMYISLAWYWYSHSSSYWDYNQLWARDWVWRNASVSMSTSIDSFQKETITQIVTNISWSATNNLAISTQYPPYPWLTYTIYVDSVASAYDIGLWTWVTNPFNITLPTNCSKKCLITVLATSSTTWIVTSCTIES